MSSVEHWQGIYQSKNSDDVSWFEASAEHSLDFIALSKLDKQASIIDIGGGASVLASELLAKQFESVCVLDISLKAIETSKQRLGTRANEVQWHCHDLLTFNFQRHQFALWHDRAVFHFLTEQSQQVDYVNQLTKALKLGGYAVIATFDIGGPSQCSGITIKQYSWKMLAQTLGESFEVVAHTQVQHTTPAGQSQLFNYCLFKKVS